MPKQQPRPAEKIVQAVALRALEEVFALSKRRLRFSKLGMGKYISHLDLLRTFQRAIVRAELPVKFTQGFNPHQIISFALPLPIGVTSETEFVDIDFDEKCDNETIIKKLNENLPYDLKIIDAQIPQIHPKEITYCEYEIKVKTDKINIEKIKNFFEEKEILAMKKTKKGEKEINIMEMIKSFELVNSSEDEAELKLIISAGEMNSLKPDIVTKAMEKYLGIDEFKSTQIHRTKIFCGVDEKIKDFC